MVSESLPLMPAAPPGFELFAPTMLGPFIAYASGAAAHAGSGTYVGGGLVSLPQVVKPASRTMRLPSSSPNRADSARRVFSSCERYVARDDTTMAVAASTTSAPSTSAIISSTSVTPR